MNRFNQIFLLTVFFILGNSSFSLAEEKPVKGTIKGQILDKETKEVVSYATVNLLNENEKSIGGALTDDNGEFHLKNIPLGEYTLVIQFVGYETFKKSVLLTKESKSVDLSISIEENVSELEEVVVEGKKAMIENRIDKKIVNVSEAMIAEGNLATEVLNTIPEVNVDANGQISLRGESNVRVLIDGKPSQIDPSQILQSMPADAIDKIEVITNPSAKYDPEGLSGIINVITKKDRMQGLNGSISANLGSRDKYSGGINLNYRYKKFNTFLQSYQSDNRYISERTLERTYTSIDQANFSQKENGLSKNGYGNLKVGFDYFIDSLNTLTFSVQRWQWRGDDTNIYRNIDHSTGEESFYKGLFYNRSGGDEANLNYRRELEKGSLEMDAFIEKGSADFNPSNFFKSGELMDYEPLTEIVNNANWYFGSFAIDYETALTEKSKLELGYKGQIIDAEVQIEDDKESFERPDLYEYPYLENIHAVYGNYMNQLTEKFTVKAGLRVENASIDGGIYGTVNEVSVDTTFNINYTSLFPTLHFQYKLSEESQFGLSYSRRIQRPDVMQLLPVENSNNPQSVQVGNPGLQPSFTNSMELQFGKTKEKFSLNSSLYIRHSTDIIRGVTSFDEENNRTVMTYANLGESLTGGLSLSGQISITDWFNVSPSMDIYYLDITDENSNFTIPEDAKPLNFSAKLNTEIQLPWDIQFQAMGRYSGERYDAQSINQPNYNLDLAVRKKVLKGAGNVSLKVNNLIYSGYPSTVYGDGFTENVHYYGENPIFRASFTYSFGGKFQGRQKRKLEGSGGL